MCSNEPPIFSYLILLPTALAASRQVAIELFCEGWASQTAVSNPNSTVSVPVTPIFPANATGITAASLRDARNSQLKRRFARNALRACWHKLLKHSYRALLRPHPLSVALHKWRRQTKQVALPSNSFSSIKMIA